MNRPDREQVEAIWQHRCNILAQTLAFSQYLANKETSVKDASDYILSLLEREDLAVRGNRPGHTLVTFLDLKLCVESTLRHALEILDGNRP